MRELKALLIYMTGAVCLVLGILASANWAVSEYHSRLPVEAEPHTTAVASKAELAADAADDDDPFRRPVWIEPTKKYIYTPAQVMIVKSDSMPPPVTMPKPQGPVTMPKPQGKVAVKPTRSRIAVNGEARRAYRTGGQEQQLLILPLQHQAPN